MALSSGHTLALTLSFANSVISCSRHWTKRSAVIGSRVTSMPVSVLTSDRCAGEADRPGSGRTSGS